MEQALTVQLFVSAKDMTYQDNAFLLTAYTFTDLRAGIAQLVKRLTVKLGAMLLLLIIIKRISTAHICRTRWEHRAL